MGTLLGIAPCFTCKNPFAFDPDRVPSVAIDPTNGMPTDMGGDPQRAVKQPLCPSCIRVINRKRAELGQPIGWSDEDTAEALTRRTHDE